MSGKFEAIRQYFTKKSPEEDDGKKKIIDILGEKVFEDVITNLANRWEKGLSNDNDMENLAESLGMSTAYKQIIISRKQLEKEINSVENKCVTVSVLRITYYKYIIEKLFKRWALEKTDDVSKKTLHIAFGNIPNLRFLVGILNEDYKIVDEGSNDTNNVSKPCEKISSNLGFTVDVDFVHLNLRGGRHTAEDILRDKEDGSYLVRTSVSRHGDYAIVMKNQVNYRISSIITGRGTQYKMGNSAKMFLNLKELLNHYTHHPIVGDVKLGKLIYPSTSQCDVEMNTPTSPLSSQLQPNYNYVVNFNGSNQHINTFFSGNNVNVILNQVNHLIEDPEDRQKFITMVGDGDITECLEKLIRLKEENKFFLPSLSLVIKATCLIQYQGPVTSWHGTGFLASKPGFSGFILLASGHTFYDIDSQQFAEDFENFSFYFSNLEGVRELPIPAGVVKKSLDDLASLGKSTIFASCKNNQLIKKEDGIIERSTRPNDIDCFALVVKDSSALDRLKEEGLDCFTIASETDLDSCPDEPLVIFGYPGMPGGSASTTIEPEGASSTTMEPGGAPSTAMEPYPLRFSHGIETIPNFPADDTKCTPDFKERRLFYNLDTDGGSSGSAVIGSKYHVKGIHKSKMKNYPFNAAQSLKPVIEALESLGCF